jgi:hypothetical protein
MKNRNQNNTGKAEKNPRGHMSTGAGENKSASRSVKGMAKDTGGNPGKKDGLSSSRRPSK